MRRILIGVAVLAAASLAAGDARAELGSELEVSGNVTTLTGWQRANDAGSARFNPARGGLLGDGFGVHGVGNGIEQFGFGIDQVEVDLAKSFGENIRLRADIDFNTGNVGRVALAGASGYPLLEQGYATGNIPVGNGVELLLGRFNAGFGSESVDRNELTTMSHGMIHRTLLPHNVTGTRLGYNVNESVRWELFVVNDLGDQAPGATSSLPSGGFNAVYAWGEYATPSWLKLSGAIGPEQGTLKGYSFLGDLSASWAANDAFSLGLEGVYRQDDLGAAVGDNAQYIAGGLSGSYLFSDVWDGTLRYTYVWDLDSSDVAAFGVVTNENTGQPGLGYSGVNHEVTLATGYMITDGARFVFEGRVDVAQASAAGATMGFGYGVGGMFAYSF